MIYKHKLSFRNVSNDLCVTFKGSWMLQSTHNYKAIWPQIIFTFSFMNPITLTFKCLKLHVTSLAHSQNPKYAWMNRLITKDRVARLHGVLRQIQAFQLLHSSLSMEQMCVISYQYATLLRHISICPYRKHTFSFSNKSRDRQIIKKYI